MNISFLADYCGFGYARVGGAESCVRRLAQRLVGSGHNIHYVLYGADQDATLSHSDGIRVTKLTRFSKAVKLLKTEPGDHVVTVLLRPKEDIQFGLLRRLLGRRTRFHKMFFGRGSGIAGSVSHFVDSQLPYNGAVFALNEYAFDSIPPTATRKVLLRPPIPDEFYLTPDQKETNKALNVIFMGRLDPEKGIYDVIRLFEQLACKKGFSVAIHGYTWRGLAESVDIHRYLREQDTIAYSSRPHREYSEHTQTTVRDILRTADVIILPYREFNRTLDPPLILLEAMASLCIPITCPVGTIPGLIHRRDCLINADTFVDDAEKRVLAVREDIHGERQELFDWNQRFSELRASEVAARFVESVSFRQRRIA